MITRRLARTVSRTVLVTRVVLPVFLVSTSYFNKCFRNTYAMRQLNLLIMDDRP
jgi:hypothetical protein